MHAINPKKPAGDRGCYCAYQRRNTPFIWRVVTQCLTAQIVDDTLTFVAQ